MTSLVFVESGAPRTTSLLVAEKFGKQHKNVMASIAALECSEEFGRLNFQPSSYLNEQNKSQPMYSITRDGFTLLAMGFTGKKAMAWKELYIAAFNAMEKELTRRAIQTQDELWKQARLDGKKGRRELTDAVQEFATYASSQGSKSATMYYMSITKMEYKALFMVESAVGQAFRDMLTTIQSSRLLIAEDVAQRALREGMTKGLHYKDIYQLARQRVEALATIVGKSLPGDDRPMLGA